MKQMLSILLSLILLSGTALGAGSNAIQAMQDSAQSDILAGLDGDSRQMLGNISFSDCTDFGMVFHTLWQNSRQAAAGVIKSALYSVSKTAVVMILCGCAAGFSSSTKMPSVILTMAGALGITAVIANDLTGLLSLCKTTAEEISVFSNAMLPVVLTAVTLCGAPTSGALSCTATIFALNLCISLITSVLIPAVSAYIAMITVNSALGNGMLTRLAEFIRWAVSGVLKILVTVFIGYVTVFGSVGRSIDSATVRAAKFAMSGSIPVVGGILSNAAETVLSSAVVLKNSIGIFGMLCAVSICLLPFLQIGLNYLFFRTGMAVLSPICPSLLLGLMDGITNSFRLILGMLGSCCAIIFFELVFTVVFFTP
jgi:stage III sporulation protein AE